MGEGEKVTTVTTQGIDSFGMNLSVGCIYIQSYVYNYLSCPTWCVPWFVVQRAELFTGVYYKDDVMPSCSDNGGGDWTAAGVDACCPALQGRVFKSVW